MFESEIRDAIEELYADDVVSTEAQEAPGMTRQVQGKQSVLGKNQWWAENHEVHESHVEGPFPHGDDRFAVIFKYDVTNKPSKQRYKMEEVGLFQVQNGKIVKEEFFYDMG